MVEGRKSQYHNDLWKRIHHALAYWIPIGASSLVWRSLPLKDTHKDHDVCMCFFGRHESTKLRTEFSFKVTGFRQSFGMAIFANLQFLHVTSHPKTVWKTSQLNLYSMYGWWFRNPIPNHLGCISCEWDKLPTSTGPDFWTINSISNAPGPLWNLLPKNKSWTMEPLPSSAGHPRKTSEMMRGPWDPSHSGIKEQSLSHRPPPI